MVTEPVGVPEAAVTAMVKLSLTPTSRLEFDAVMVVVLAVSAGVMTSVFAGQGHRCKGLSRPGSRCCRW